MTIDCWFFSYETKDIGPFVWDAFKAIVPACVAWVAYKVSKDAAEATQAQRDIAANQYKLSLFEKRSEKYMKFLKWKGVNIIRLEFQSLGELKTIIFELSKLFNNQKIYETFNEMYEELEKKIEHSGKAFDLHDPHLDHEKVIITTAFEDVKRACENIEHFISETLETIGNQLVVPQEPFIQPPAS